MAALAVVALGAVGALAWMSLGSREDPPPPDPAAAAGRFADAWTAGDPAAIESVLIRRPGTELTDAMAAFDTLEPTALRVGVGEVVEGDEDGFATVTILPELDVPGVGTWAWTADLAMERGRGSWRIRWDHTSFHPSLAEGLHFETRTDGASRAPILAVDGTPLTATGEVVTIGIEPLRIPSGERLAASLAPLVPEAVEPLAKVLARADLVQTWFYPLVTVPSERLAGIRERVATLPGIILRTSDGRVGASPGFGRHVLGRVVDASADQALERGVEPGSPIGVGGLEEEFDEQLRGSATTEIVAVERDGDVRASVASFSDDPAESVRTTLDGVVQEAIENALVGRQTNVAVVAVGPDGGVLGAASRPLDGYNRAFAGNFAPGAAVWGLTVLATLDEGITAQDLVECPSVATVGGVRFENLTEFDLGTVTVDEAVANGCRSSIALLGGGLPRRTLSDLAASVGFGTEIDGMPTPQWPQARDIAEEAASGVGQAQVLSSVAHLASIAAAFIDGTWDAPHLVVDESGEIASSQLGASPSAIAAARAIFEVAAARTSLPSDVGLVAGEGSSSEGNLGWASVTSDELGLVILVERGTRAEAISIAERFFRELTGLRNREG